MSSIAKGLLCTESAGAPKIFLVLFKVDFIRFGHEISPFLPTLLKDETLDKEESSMALLGRKE